MARDYDIATYKKLLLHFMGGIGSVVCDAPVVDTADDGSGIGDESGSGQGEA